MGGMGLEPITFRTSSERSTIELAAHWARAHWARLDLNQGLPLYKSGVLPLNYVPIKLV